MTIRSRVEASFTRRLPLTWAIYLVVPALCLSIPGPGVLLAAIWVVFMLWFGRQKVSVVGLRAPRQWPALVGFAVGIAIIVWILDAYAITPIAESLTGARKQLGLFADLEHNWAKFLLWLALGWIIGGILEEVIFRGFLINLGARIFGDRMIWPLAVFSSAIFGLSHLYQGMVGVISTGVISLLFAVVFILSRRNLLLIMLVHGFVNTISLSLAFLGLRTLA